MDRFESTINLINIARNLPNRRGKRPITMGRPIHVQCGDHGDGKALRDLVDEVIAWPDIEAGPLPIGSALPPASSKAVRGFLPHLQTEILAMDQARPTAPTRPSRHPDRATNRAPPKKNRPTSKPPARRRTSSCNDLGTPMRDQVQSGEFLEDSDRVGRAENGYRTC